VWVCGCEWVCLCVYVCGCVCVILCGCVGVCGVCVCVCVWDSRLWYVWSAENGYPQLGAGMYPAALIA